MLIALRTPQIMINLFGISRNVPVEAYTRNAISTGTSQCSFHFLKYELSLEHRQTYILGITYDSFIM